MKASTKTFAHIVVCASLMLGAMPASAAVIVLKGALDASQVVAPIYETDADGNQVLNGNGDPIALIGALIVAAANRRDGRSTSRQRWRGRGCWSSPPSTKSPNS